MSGYLGALTYISGLVVLTANHTLAIGPYEEQASKLPFNQVIIKGETNLKSDNYCTLQGGFLLLPP